MNHGWKKISLIWFCLVVQVCIGLVWFVLFYFGLLCFSLVEFGILQTMDRQKKEQKDQADWERAAPDSQNKFLWLKYSHSLFQIWLTFIQNKIEICFSNMDTQTKTKKQTKKNTLSGI